MSAGQTLVTGAGGFIGGAVVQALVKGGVQVRAGMARPRPDARLTGADITPCDLFDDAALAPALSGVDTVVHCAWTDDGAQSTRRLLEAATASGVGRFVHLSSVAVYGAAEGTIDEQTPPRAPLDGYARSKIASEADCRRAAAGGMRVCILRPALVYGPGSAYWTEPFVRRLASGRWRRLDERGDGFANLVHVADVARMAAFAAGAPLPQVSVFNANGPETPTWNDYLDRLADALGLPRPTGRQALSPAMKALNRPLRVAQKKLLAKMQARPFIGSHRWQDRAAETLALAPSSQEAALFRLRATYAMDRAAAAGFTPLIGLDQGIADCADWARARGLV
jgi:UDP-glucose 4-epimerase